LRGSPSRIGFTGSEWSNWSAEAAKPFDNAGDNVDAMNAIEQVWTWLKIPANYGALGALFTGLGVVVAIMALLKRRSKSKENDAPSTTEVQNTHSTRTGVVQHIEQAPGSQVTINKSLTKEQIQAHTGPLLARIEGKEERIIALSAELRISKLAVSRFFETLEQEEVPPERWAEKLTEIASTHIELLTRRESLRAEDDEVARMMQWADEAIEAGHDFRAEQLLYECEAKILEAVQRTEQAAKAQKLNAAKTRIKRGRLALTRLEYLAAAEHFEKAAELADAGGDTDLRNRSLHDRASALQTHGTERGDNKRLGRVDRDMAESVESPAPRTRASAMGDHPDQPGHRSCETRSARARNGIP
jgi:hypothetical protein